MNTLDKALNTIDSLDPKTIVRNRLEHELDNPTANWNTSMLLDIICDDISTKEFDFTFHGRTIYCNHKPVAVIEVSKEGPNMIALYKYRIM